MSQPDVFTQRPAGGAVDLGDQFAVKRRGEENVLRHVVFDR
jgi:hypothetical protein